MLVALNEGGSLVVTPTTWVVKRDKLRYILRRKEPECLVHSTLDLYDLDEYIERLNVHIKESF